MHAVKHKYLPFFMWLLPLLFFAYQFILRLWPGLMMPKIMAQFSITAGQFGTLAAFYYYGYASMQIPVAILLDKFSTRYVVCAFAVLCGLATLVFTYTSNFHVAVLSRALVGVGSAVGFLGVSKVTSEWFAKDQYARMIGFSFTFGLMGAIYGGKPVSILIEHNQWQHVALTLAIISIMIGIIACIFLRSPKTANHTTKKEQFNLANFKTILTSPFIWFLAISNLLMVGSLEGFTDVWGVPYLITTYGIEKSNAAGIISCVFLGMLFGGPLLASLARKFGTYRVIQMCGFGMALAFVLLLQWQSYNPWLLSGLFFIVGLMCCYQVIVFAAGSELVAPRNLGVTVAFLNSINMLGGSFFHTLIGHVMDYFWAGAISSDGIRLYDITAYRYALSVIPVCACIGAIMVLALGWVKNKR